MVRAIVIQHTAADTAAAFLPLLDELGVSVQCIRLDRGEALPRVVACDLLLTFGAPISLLEQNVPGWVEQEKELIQLAVDQQKMVIGVCFGAQLLAIALGARVKRNDATEVGWHPIRRVESKQGASTFNSLPDSFNAFHWHQNTFEIPTHAVHLYGSRMCQNQAFQYGDRILGFQFHFEANQKTIRNFLLASKLWRSESDSVQSKEEILRLTELYLLKQQATLKAFVNEAVDRLNC
ncbi:MAG: type 1 glutamine amidotransferase [Planctomycetota bacterium]|nr:type 1 glutamine amidotransferase [Planctomycetota bacterium]